MARRKLLSTQQMFDRGMPVGGKNFKSEERIAFERKADAYLSGKIKRFF